MLKRVQHYAQANPLQTWLLFIAFQLTFNLTGYFLIPGKRTPGLFLLFVCLALGPATFGLMQRFSEERRRTHPVPPEQEAQIGLLSVFFVCGSIGMLAFLVCSNRLGLAVSSDVGGYLLMLYALFEFLAIVFGYVARCTQIGLLGLKLAVGWLAFIVVAGYACLLLRGR